MSELMKNYEARNTAKDEEFDNFMVKVNEVTKLMSGLTSKNSTTSSDALKLVDNYLENPSEITENIDEDTLRIKSSKTVINKKAFNSLSEQNNQTQSPEEFMKICEEDAKQRAESLRLGKEASETFKKQAIAAFNNGEFEKALSFYNKAINEFRQSAHLYICRALTYVKLELYRKAIEDCDLVLRCFDEKSFKALLYKAKSHKKLGEDKEAETYIQQAIKNYPKFEVDICEYINENC